MQDSESMIKYFLMAIDRGDMITMNMLKQILTPLQIYVQFKKKSMVFTEKLTNEMHILENKLQTFSKMCECPVCLNEKIICIPLACCHYLCEECYAIIKITNVCPICRMHI